MRHGLPSFVDLVHHADRAYKQPPNVSDNETGCEARVEFLGADLAVVAFRGTSDFQDVWMDVRATPWYDRQLRLGWCHHGFLMGVRAIWPELRTALLGRRVIFTGHSKGGAEASLACMAACQVPGIYPIALVPFSPARCVIGNRAETILASRSVFYLRFEPAGDPVPEVPPGYNHAAKRKVDIGEGWDFKADHPLMTSILPGVAKWEITHGWAS